MTSRPVFSDEPLQLPVPATDTTLTREFLLKMGQTEKFVDASLVEPD